jgi:hypothetical protein
MTLDPGSRALHRIGWLLAGFMLLGFAAAAGVGFIRAPPSHILTAMIGAVGAAGFIGFAFYCFRCGVRGRIPEWYSEFVRHS